MNSSNLQHSKESLGAGGSIGNNSMSPFKRMQSDTPSHLRRTLQPNPTNEAFGGFESNEQHEVSALS